VNTGIPDVFVVFRGARLIGTAGMAIAKSFDAVI
jgi:hypothetical protein